ncbi:hypothetical protein TU79_12600 [Pseudomonas trivialis]|uniref:HTH lysR-type domain-containing protein n=1 Tax=Pseudomonas trivialis TaxID=200450 RepID=A0A0R2ZSG7_9PSED|nr:hypothetical protein TU79_12600 [Pseudomonas trivialis]
MGVLNHLVAFETAARLGSFRAAAEEMFVTQGAVAQQVRALEDKLGVELFDRLPRGLKPNQHGLEYVARIRLALGIIEDATEDLLNRDELNLPNQVLISTTPAFASRWLIPKLSHLADLYPDVSLMIDASDVTRPLKGKGRVDMAVRWGTPPFNNVHTRYLLSGRAFVVCSPSLAGASEWRQPDDLAEVPHISDSHNNWQRWYATYGENKTKITGPTFSQTNLALEAAEQGMGVALVPGLLVENSLKSGTLIRVLGGEFQLDTDAGFYILTGEDSTPSPAVAKVVDWLLSEANQDCLR